MGPRKRTCHRHRLPGGVPELRKTRVPIRAHRMLTTVVPTIGKVLGTTRNEQDAVYANGTCIGYLASALQSRGAVAQFTSRAVNLGSTGSCSCTPRASACSAPWRGQ